MDLTISTQHRDTSTQGHVEEDTGTYEHTDEKEERDYMASQNLGGQSNMQLHDESLQEPPLMIESTIQTTTLNPTSMSMATTRTELIKVAELDGFKHESVEQSPKQRRREVVVSQLKN